jgi:hypothetical protein
MSWTRTTLSRVGRRIDLLRERLDLLVEGAGRRLEATDVENERARWPSSDVGKS